MVSGNEYDIKLVKLKHSKSYNIKRNKIVLSLIKIFIVSVHKIYIR